MIPGLEDFSVGILGAGGAAGKGEVVEDMGEVVSGFVVGMGM